MSTSKPHMSFPRFTSWPHLRIFSCHTRHQRRRPMQPFSRVAVRQVKMAHSPRLGSRAAATPAVRSVGTAHRVESRWSMLLPRCSSRIHLLRYPPLLDMATKEGPVLLYPDSHLQSIHLYRSFRNALLSRPWLLHIRQHNNIKSIPRGVLGQS